MEHALLKMQGICKSFLGVEVLHSVDLTIHRGKVTALVGENGAGKSTLMKILMGEYEPDGGSILLEGSEVHFASPHQALTSGISMMFQELSPFPNMTVAQNIFVGREPHHIHLVDMRRQRQMAAELLQGLDIHLNVDAAVRDLTVSEIQLLEIAKAVSYNSKIVVMDEPTSSLTATEVKLLFDTIHRLKKQGVAVIYISHKLDELFEIADEVCVLRDGNMISSRPIGQVDRQQMISEMVGRTLSQMYPTVEKEIGEEILRVEHLERKGVFQDASFEIHRGEILGFAGIVGAGRTELISSIFGLDRYTQGKIWLNEKEITIRSPRDAIHHHFALIPEDRARCGLNLKASVKTNVCMAILSKISRRGFSNKRAEEQTADDMIRQVRIKVTSRNQPVASLSGGNQQKVVVGKWLLTNPDIVFMDEPTRGVDVGAKYEIYQLMQSLAKEGKAVVMISSEMPELLGVCDRILVLKEGRILGQVKTKETSQEQIMAMIVNG